MKAPSYMIIFNFSFPFSIVDFWRLTWQEDIRLIVMLTKTFEVVRLMCSQYWPLHMNVPETYGAFQVELIKEERYAHFKVSTGFFQT